MKSNVLRSAVSVSNLACDVGMDRITAFCPDLSRPGAVASWDVANRTDEIIQLLHDVVDEAKERGISAVRVVAEPTGVYHKLLFRIARQLGIETGLVDGSHVAKMREVTFGDGGKTDERDPVAIHAVAVHGRVVADRKVPEVYELLRHAGTQYQQCEQEMITAKARVHRVLKLLFPDFDFGTEFLHGPSGGAILRCFGFNPNRIAAHRAAPLYARLRKRCRIQRASVARLLAQARLSASSVPPGRLTDALEAELALAFSDVALHTERRVAARLRLEELYDEARGDDPKLPALERAVISKAAFARLLGELGPLTDYGSWRQALRMGGLNLCERKSGRYTGQTRTSRKGRPGVRVVLNQMALPLARRDRLFGTYYRRKIDIEKMPGKKAITAVARKILKMIWGWYHSGAAFDITRVFASHPPARQAA